MNTFQTKISPAAGVAGFASPLFSFVVSLLFISTCAFASNEKAIAYFEATSSDGAGSSSTTSSVSANYLGKVNKLPNRGFIKNPSGESTEKFPMCDDFLNVEWLDKENGYGYVEHDLYLSGNLLPPKKSLIYIHEKKVDHMFDLNQYDKYGKLEKVLKGIRANKKYYSNLSAIPAVDYEGGTAFFSHYDYTKETYADNHQNICIVYPDNEFAWLVESVDAGNIYSQEEIDRGVEHLKKLYPDYREEWFRNIFVGDINYDGIADYYSRESFIYSKNGSYQVIKKLGNGSDKEGSHIIFGTQNTDLTCKVYGNNGLNLITDGKNYLLDKQCNLTQLSTQ